MKRIDFISRNPAGKATRYRSFVTEQRTITIDCDRAFELRLKLRHLDPWRFTPLLAFEWLIYLATPASLVSLIWLPWWVPAVTIPVCFVIAYPSLKQTYADVCYAAYDAWKVSPENMRELGIFVRQPPNVI